MNLALLVIPATAPVKPDYFANMELVHRIQDVAVALVPGLALAVLQVLEQQKARMVSGAENSWPEALVALPEH